MMRALILAAALGWAALFLSSHAVLIHGAGPDSVDDWLTCTYFTGTSRFNREFRYGSGGPFDGIPACPRIVKF
jgi:hypothetical protein